MDYRPGTVLVWHDFSLPNLGRIIKNVIFVFLGRDSILDYPLCLHFHRATTNTKEGSLVIKFSQGEYRIFDANCMLNFNERHYSIPNDYCEQNIDKIHILGELPDDVVRRIWNCIKKSPHYSEKVKSSIRDSLQRNGIEVKK